MRHLRLGTRFERRTPVERDLAPRRRRRRRETLRVVGVGQRPGEAAPALDRLARADAHACGRGSGGSARAWSAGGRARARRPRASSRSSRSRRWLVTRSHSARSTPVGVVDVEPQRLGGRALERDHLDLGLELGEPVLDRLLQLLHRRFLVALDSRPVCGPKKGGPGPTSDKGSGTEEADAEYSRGAADQAARRWRRGRASRLEHQRHRAVVDQLDRHPGAERARASRRGARRSARRAARPRSAGRPPR